MDLFAKLFSPEGIAGFLSLLFTIMVLSYLVGDNPAFRLAIHAFIGVSAGYVAAIVLVQVIGNQLLSPLTTAFTNPETLSATLVSVGFPLVLGLVLLAKLSPRLEWLGRPVVAFLVGTGAAAAVAGAMMGTIYPQVTSSVNLFGQNIIQGVFVLVGTVATLAYFQFSVTRKSAAGESGKRGWFMTAFAFVGQVFIAMTLGAVFAGTFSAALTALIDRAQSVVLFFDQFLH